MCAVWQSKHLRLVFEEPEGGPGAELNYLNCSAYSPQNKHCTTFKQFFPPGPIWTTRTMCLNSFNGLSRGARKISLSSLIRDFEDELSCLKHCDGLGPNNRPNTLIRSSTLFEYRAKLLELHSLGELATLFELLFEGRRGIKRSKLFKLVGGAVFEWCDSFNSAPCPRPPPADPLHNMVLLST